MQGCVSRARDGSGPLAFFAAGWYRADMAILGAHQSIAGGYDKAVETAHALGCDCVQLFTKNSNQWRARTVSADEAERFRAALARSGMTHPLAHDSYLINLASPDATLWRKSVDAMVQELLRAAALGIPYVVAHPGAYTSGSEEAGLRRIVEALDEIDRQTRAAPVGCLLETTAGQGTSIGWRFEQLAAILQGGKADDMHVSTKGGQVKVNRSNFVVNLAPYFFPIYTVGACLVWAIAAERFQPVLSAVVGFTLAFHFALTFYSLKQHQSDIAEVGWFFAIPLILALNTVIGVLVLRLMAPEGVSLKAFFVDTGVVLAAAARWIRLRV